MAEPLKIVQIGIGGWGWSWIGVAQHSTAWELQAVVDVNPDALKRAQDVYGLRPDQTYSSLDEALKHTQADAALIVVPPEVHARVAENALSHGLHCLIEAARQAQPGMVFDRPRTKHEPGQHDRVLEGWPDGRDTQLVAGGQLGAAALVRRQIDVAHLAQA